MTAPEPVPPTPMPPTVDPTATPPTPVAPEPVSSEDQIRTLSAQIETYRRAEVERFAASVLADPKDLWLGTASANDFVGDDGTVDEARVLEHVTALAAERPHWAIENQRPTAPPSQRPIESLRPGATSRPVEPEAPTWSSVLRPALPHRR